MAPSEKLKSILTGRLAGPSFWLLCGLGVQKIVQLGSNLLLTRLLFPEAFGLMVIVNTVLVGAQMFSDVGIRPAVIRSADTNDLSFLNSAWTLQVIRGCFLFLAISAAAYPASIIYESHQLFPLLCFCALNALFLGFNSINLILYERSLKIKPIMLVKIAGQAICVVIMATLAWQFKSVWSLAIGVVLGVLCEVIIGHLFLKGHKHKLQLNRKHSMAILRYGSWIFWSTVFTYFTHQGAKMIEGYFVTKDTLAMLAIAATFAGMAGEIFEKLAGNIIFPALSEAYRKGSTELSVLIRKARLYCILATAPIFGFLSLISIWLVTFLYDARYHLAGPILTLYAFASATKILPLVFNFGLLAKGESKTHFKCIGVTAFSNVLALTLGYTFFGLVGLIVSPALASLVGHLYTSITIRKTGWVSSLPDIYFFLIMFAFATLSFLVNYDILASFIKTNLT